MLDDTGGELKQFKVNCFSDHLTAFGVAVSSDTTVGLYSSYKYAVYYAIVYF